MSDLRVVVPFHEAQEKDVMYTSLGFAVWFIESFQSRLPTSNLRMTVQDDDSKHYGVLTESQLHSLSPVRPFECNNTSLVNHEGACVVWDGFGNQFQTFINSEMGLIDLKVILGFTPLIKPGGLYGLETFRDKIISIDRTRMSAFRTQMPQFLRFKAGDKVSDTKGCLYEVIKPFGCNYYYEGYKGEHSGQPSVCVDCHVIPTMVLKRLSEDRGDLPVEFGEQFAIPTSYAHILRWSDTSIKPHMYVKDLHSNYEGWVVKVGNNTTAIFEDGHILALSSCVCADIQPAPKNVQKLIGRYIKYRGQVMRIQGYSGNPEKPYAAVCVSPLTSPEYTKEVYESCKIIATGEALYAQGGPYQELGSYELNLLPEVNVGDVVKLNDEFRNRFRPDLSFWHDLCEPDLINAIAVITEKQVTHETEALNSKMQHPRDPEKLISFRLFRSDIDVLQSTLPDSERDLVIEHGGTYKEGYVELDGRTYDIRSKQCNRWVLEDRVNFDADIRILT